MDLSRWPADASLAAGSFLNSMVRYRHSPSQGDGGLRFGLRSLTYGGPVRKAGLLPGLSFFVDARVKPGHDERRAHSTRLLSFTFSASRYTLLPISLNFSLIFAMPSSMVPAMLIPTAAGSFSVAA
jgi:hypothetical protein